MFVKSMPVRKYSKKELRGALIFGYLVDACEWMIELWGFVNHKSQIGDRSIE